MQNLMQNFLILFGLALVVLCWLLVISHQLEWQTFNVARYPSLQSSLYIAYTVAALSASLFVLAILLGFKK